MFAMEDKAILACIEKSELLGAAKFKLQVIKELRSLMEKEENQFKQAVIYELFNKVKKMEYSK